jgi:hypothetical protein
MKEAHFASTIGLMSFRAKRRNPGLQISMYNSLGLRRCVKTKYKPQIFTDFILIGLGINKIVEICINIILIIRI